MSAPAHWRRYPVDALAGGVKNNVVIGPFGSSLRVADYCTDGVPLIFVRHIRSGGGWDQTHFVSQDKARELSSHFALPGDVLVTKMGDPPGDVTVYTGTRPAIITADCIRLRVGPELDAKFVAFALQAPEAQAQMLAITSGVAQKKMSLGRFRSSVSVAAPGLEEQRRVVEVLEASLSRLDAGDRYLQSVLAKGRATQGAVLQAALQTISAAGDMSALAAARALRCPADMKRGRPDAAAPAAVEVPWGELCPTISLEQATDPVRTISYGILKPGPNLSTGVPYVRVLNMRNDVLAVEDLHRASPEIAGQYSRSRLQPRDVLISIRGTYGRVVLVPEALAGGNITQDTARLALLPQLLPEFVALVLRSPWAQQHLKRVARGVGVKGVNITDLREVPMPLPSLEEQARLVGHVEALTADIAAATKAAGVGLRRVSALRRSLLAAAASGRLNAASARSDAHV